MKRRLVTGMTAVLILLAACQPPATPIAAQPAPTEPIPATATPVPTEVVEEASAMPTATSAANADVEHVRAVENASGTWTFHVTVRHPDTGWEDYADGWDVVLPDGTVVKPDPSSPFTRLLLHPHETEQPFTRSQGGITIPDGIAEVTVRAHDLVDGFGGAVVVVHLGAESGPGFEVERR